MTHKFIDWCGEISTTVGQGDLALGGPVAGGYIPFDSILVDGDEVWYAIVDGDNRESGSGTFSSGVLERTTVNATFVNGTFADNGPLPIDLSGSAEVYCTLTAESMDQLLLSIESSNSSLTAVEQRVADIEVVDASQTVRIDDVVGLALSNESGLAVVTQDVSDVSSALGVEAVRIDDVEAVDTTQNSRLDALESTPVPGGGIEPWTPQVIVQPLVVDTIDLPFAGGVTANLVVTSDTSVITPASLGLNNVFAASSEKSALVENDLKATYFSLVLPTVVPQGDLFAIYFYDDIVAPTNGIPIMLLATDGVGGFQFKNAFTDTPVGTVFTAAQIESSEWAATFNMNDGLSADFSIYRDGVLDSTFNVDISAFSLVGQSFHIFDVIQGGNSANVDGAQFTQLRAPVNVIPLSTQLVGSPIVDPASYPTVTEDSAFIVTGLSESVLSTSGYIDNAYTVGFTASGDLSGIVAVDVIVKGHDQTIEDEWAFDITGKKLTVAADGLFAGYVSNNNINSHYLQTRETVTDNGGSEAYIEITSYKQGASGSKARLGTGETTIEVQHTNGDGGSQPLEDYAAVTTSTSSMVGGIPDLHIATRAFVESLAPATLSDLVRRDVAAGLLTCFVNYQYLIYGTTGAQSLSINLPPVLDGKKGDRIVLYVKATTTINYIKLFIDAFGSTNIFDGHSTYETPIIATADAIGYTVTLDHSGDVNMGWIPNFNVMYKA